MINDWLIQNIGPSLYSFIGLDVFYHRYAPYLEMRTKVFRVMVKQYFRTNISMMAWTPALLEIFQDIKVCITFSPVLTYTHFF